MVSNNRRRLLQGIAAAGTLATFGSVASAQENDLVIEPSDSLTAIDVTDPDLTAEDLAQTLLGEDIELVEDSVEYTGAEEAGGQFAGGEDVIGIDDGTILSSGQVVDVEGPNESLFTSTEFDEPGDEDLTELVDGTPTFDAAVLEFEITVPEDSDGIALDYVFGSDEYNQGIGSPSQDVFGFFVDGENCAVVPDPDDPDGSLPVAIDSINEGGQNPDIEPTNPDLFVNNDPFFPNFDGETVDEDDLLDTEMDGFTVPLTCEAAIDPDEPIPIKLAIASTFDVLVDSWVLLEGGGLTVVDDPDPKPEPKPVPTPEPDPKKEKKQKHKYKKYVEKHGDKKDKESLKEYLKERHDYDKKDIKEMERAVGGR